MEVTHQHIQSKRNNSVISKGLWRRLRSGVMFVIAVLTSPCCVPLFLPILLSLLAGTPAALWIGNHIGWVYGGFTLVSVISLVLAIRWLQRPTLTSKASGSILDRQ